MKVEVFAHNSGYRVTLDGKLINKKGNQVIGTINNRGYISTHIRKNGKMIELALHRLQGYQKFGNKLFDKGIEVRHKNDVRIDASFENILIGTHTENMNDVAVDKRVKKAFHAASFLIKYNFDAVTQFHKDNGNSYKDTMANFGITSKGTLHYILNRKSPSIHIPAT